MKFSEFAQSLQALEQTRSRKTMTELVASLFRAAAAEEIGQICYLLQGRVAPLFEAVEFGVADRLLVRAISLAYGVSEERVQKAFKRTGDMGSAAELSFDLTQNKLRRRALSVGDVFERLRAVAEASGAGSQEKKIKGLAELLACVDRLSARYIVRIPLNKLRLGFSDVTMLDALSWMLAGDKSLRATLEDAYHVRPDIGYIARTVKAEGIQGIAHVRATVGVPILSELCQRLPSADQMIAKMGRVAVEPKYDGERVQIHFQKRNGRVSVESFSRNLENISEMFPELQQIGTQLKARNVILDSEAVGVDARTGKLIPFQTTMTRKRKHAISDAQSTVPLKFFVFDILYKDGKDLLHEPLTARRKVLEQTVKEGEVLVVSPQFVTESADELRRYHAEQLKQGLEGVVVKQCASPYEPGRRGYGWVKFKETEGKQGKLTDTIDAVVMGYYRGQGKRAGFGIGAFLVGVRQGEQFVTVTKIGTGVSDMMWTKLRTALNKLKVREQPAAYTGVSKLFTPDVWAAPQLVVELAGDDLTKSPSHGAGVAVRFPRLVRIRDDKSPQDVTTIEEVMQMYEAQFAG